MHPLRSRLVATLTAMVALAGCSVRTIDPPPSVRPRTEQPPPRTTEPGPAAERSIVQVRSMRSLFRVTHDASTDPDLAVEEFVAFRIPDNAFVDWHVLRIAGAAYPEVLVP